MMRPPVKESQEAAVAADDSLDIPDYLKRSPTKPAKAGQKIVAKSNGSRTKLTEQRRQR